MKSSMGEPYYLKIKDPQQYLKYYLGIFERNYGKIRARKIISLFPKLRGKKLLDIGCGGGFYSIAAHEKKCKDITLMDVCPVCVKAAKANLPEKENLSSEGIVADATSLPLKNECFDFVLCVDILEHMQKEDMFLCEIRRVLKDNGLILIATQNSNSINYLLEAPMYRYVLKNRNWMGWDSTHLRFYTPKLLFRLLRNCGFTPIEIAGTYFMPYLLSAWLRKANRRLSMAIYHILILINNRLELKQKAFWKVFGWGIIFLCIKNTQDY